MTTYPLTVDQCRQSDPPHRRRIVRFPATGGRVCSCLLCGAVLEQATAPRNRARMPHNRGTGQATHL